MNQEHSNERTESGTDSTDQQTSSTSNDEEVNLVDEALQAEYRKAYLSNFGECLARMRRRSNATFLTKK